MPERDLTGHVAPDTEATQTGSDTHWSQKLLGKPFPDSGESMIGMTPSGQVVMRLTTEKGTFIVPVDKKMPGQDTISP